MKKHTLHTPALVILIFSLVAISCGNATNDITKQRLEDLVRKGGVDKIVIFSASHEAEIYLANPEEYPQHQELGLSGKGPHFSVKFVDEVKFMDYLNDLQSEYPESGSMHIIMQHRKQFPGEILLQWGFLIFFLVPLSLLLILISTIDIMLLNTEQKIERLTWVIVIIFVPLVGAVLYFFKGRKRIKEGNTRN